MTKTLTHHAISLDNYICFYVNVQFVCMCVCHCFFSHALSCHVMSILTCSVKKQRGGKPSTMQCPSNGPFCITDPHDVSSLALSLHSCPCSHIIYLPHKQFDEKSIMMATYYHCISKMCCSQSYLIFFTSFFMHPSPPLSPHLRLLQPPLPLPLFAFLGEWVESSIGMWVPRRAGGVCLLPEHSMCANQGLLIGQSNLSAQAGVFWWCCGVPRKWVKSPKCVPKHHII